MPLHYPPSTALLSQAYSPVAFFILTHQLDILQLFASSNSTKFFMPSLTSSIRRNSFPFDHLGVGEAIPKFRPPGPPSSLSLACSPLRISNMTSISQPAGFLLFPIITYITFHCLIGNYFDRCLLIYSAQTLSFIVAQIPLILFLRQAPSPFHTVPFWKQRDPFLRSCQAPIFPRIRGKHHRAEKCSSAWRSSEPDNLPNPFTLGYHHSPDRNVEHEKICSRILWNDTLLFIGKISGYCGMRGWVGYI